MMGVLAAFIILSAQVYSAQIASTVEVSPQNDRSDSQQTIIKSVDAISTTSNINLTHQFYFINEIFRREENYEESAYFELPKLSTFFTTLFEQIISPNAP